MPNLDFDPELQATTMMIRNFFVKKQMKDAVNAKSFNFDPELQATMMMIQKKIVKKPR